MNFIEMGIKLLNVFAFFALYAKLKATQCLIYVLPRLQVYRSSEIYLTYMRQKTQRYRCNSNVGICVYIFIMCIYSQCFDDKTYIHE